MRLLFQVSCRKLKDDMHVHEPEPISEVERRGRIRRVRHIARRLGFTGHPEYLHVYSRSGGAQYCIGPSGVDDLLVVYAEAFERDADPHDFDLEAIIAHECGHQLLVRNRHLQRILRRVSAEKFDEILASLVGSLLLGESGSSQTLVWKASVELAQAGIAPTNVVNLIEQFRQLLRHFL